MLRLNPTQIKLEARDITWHNSRHEERQKVRKAAAPTDVTNSAKMPSKEQHNSPAPTSLDRVPRCPPRPSQMGVINVREDPIVLHEPVPSVSRAYWDQILVNAETPTRTQSTPQANPTVVEHSDRFLQHHRSSEALIEEVDDSEHEDERSEDHAGDDMSFPNIESAGDPHPQQRALTSSDSKPVGEAPAASDEQRAPIEGSSRPSSTRHRLSSLFFHRKSKQKEQGGSSDSIHPHASSNVDVDGPSDTHSRRPRNSSKSSSDGPEADLGDGLYGNRHDRRTISSNLETYINREDDALGVTASSTPNKRDRSTANSPSHDSDMERNDATSETPGLLALPPRRPKRYKPLSGGPFVASEDANNPAVAQLDGPSTSQARLPSVTVSIPPSIQAASSSSIPGYPWDHTVNASPFEVSNHPYVLPYRDRTVYSSPGQVQSPHVYSNYPYLTSSPNEISSHRSLSSVGSVHSHLSTHSPTSRNLSPEVSEHLSPYRRRLSPQLPLPPPFSATPRNVTSSLAIPPSSPMTPHTPPQRQTSNPISPSLHVPFPIRVYNDSLPPNTQPQTPAGLTRNGLPPMATQNPFSYTAPARVPVNHSSRMSGRRAPFGAMEAFPGTPTRRPGEARRGVVNPPEDENADAISEQERAFRREMGTGAMRMGREEMGRGERRGLD
ncbi:hypothetical protein MMC28_007990 [Mycoblastus sanguinarius]|nr:hypothetical protein [Mycoblastus sanguinarius]